MALKEHENNTYTKEKTKVEQYLLRIIKRYFDIEVQHSKEDVEAIVVESLRRVKQSLAHNEGFLFSLNEQTGKVNLNIYELKGEQAFDKNTAFNKDFGADADTICEGNDTRLSDEREPLEHTHVISDIKNLADKINELALPDVHLHLNKKSLDVIKYTGNQAVIDLIIIEEVMQDIEEYCTQLDTYKNDLITYHENNIKEFLVLRNSIISDLENMKDIIAKAIAWLSYSQEYTNDVVSKLKTNMKKYIKNNFVLLENVQKILGFCSKTESLIRSSSKSIGYEDTASHGKTERDLSSIIVNTNGKKVTHATMVMQYENEYGDIVMMPLPFYQITDEYIVSIIPEYTEDGRVIFDMKCKTLLAENIESEYIIRDDKIIIPVTEDVSYHEAVAACKEQGYELCLMNEDIYSTMEILLQHLEHPHYFIQGSASGVDNLDFVDDNGNPLTYTNWDDDQPIKTVYNTYIKMDSSGKWSTVDWFTDKCGYIMSKPVRRFRDYFKNATVYYNLYSREV